jgi:hypothetical protein
MDRSTPRAQTRGDLEDEVGRRSRRTSSLEGSVKRSAAQVLFSLTHCADIPEALGKDGEDSEQPDTAGLVEEDPLKEAQRTTTPREQEVAALRTALSECWTLCNTLANLSSSHRKRSFQAAGRQEQQESAWLSCWRLCQQLYYARDEEHASQTTPTLELCRDFCQSLFDAREKSDEASDSVLRVSFELNNHLYNTHDRSLPDAFNCQPHYHKRQTRCCVLVGHWQRCSSASASRPATVAHRTKNFSVPRCNPAGTCATYSAKDGLRSAQKEAPQDPHKRPSLSTPPKPPTGPPAARTQNAAPQA